MPQHTEREDTSLMHGGSLEFMVSLDEDTYEEWAEVKLQFLTSKPVNDDVDGNEEIGDDFDSMLDRIKLAVDSVLKPGWKIKIEH